MLALCGRLWSLSGLHQLSAHTAACTLPHLTLPHQDERAVARGKPALAKIKALKTVKATFRYNTALILAV
jgi:hypothetical protein